MKVDKRNPRHWFYLLGFAAQVLVAIALRPLLRRWSKRDLIVLYGHKLGGNLLALRSYLVTQYPRTEVVFLTMDPAYSCSLREQGIPNVLAFTPAGARALVRAQAVIADHGLHVIKPLLSLSDIRFFDVWHGIPFKGFDAEDFRVQHRYDEIWVASPLLRKMYIEQFGFAADRVIVTGYARTDRLVQPPGAGEHPSIRKRLGLPETGKVVLFAPTWAQDRKHRNLYPFGCDEAAFFDALSSVATHTGATFAMRRHLNSGSTAHASRRPGIIELPYAEFPDTEEILLVSDILVCDWSSIAFDYLLLNRPTLFLDVEAPFAKGFSLGPEYRFGAVTKSLPDMLEQLERFLHDSESYTSEFGLHHAAMRERVYGDFADGHSARRCCDRLFARPLSDGSSR